MEDQSDLSTPGVFFQQTSLICAYVREKYESCIGNMKARVFVCGAQTNRRQRKCVSG